MNPEYGVLVDIPLVDRHATQVSGEIIFTSWLFSLITYIVYSTHNLHSVFYVLRFDA